MTLEPFTVAPMATQLHVVSVLSAAALGIWMFMQPKGTPVHRATGRVWMTIMVVAALSSFLIPATLLPVIGPFGVIHGLSVIVLAMVAAAIWAARAGRIRAHRRFVIGLYVGAILGAGAGALVPGRMISRILGYA
jgi:uncharacterized membrane protein